MELAKRAIVPLIALAIFAAAWILLPYGFWRILLLCIAGAVALLGLYDFLQKRSTLTRNYPVAARIRWLMLDLRPYLRAYIVEGDLERNPFSHDARELVHARAEGKSDTHPFGTERDTGEAGYHWIAHSIAPVENPDKSPRVTVGNDQCARPYRASVLNVSAMSFGSLGQNAIEALNLGAKMGGFYHDTGEGGLSDHHLKHGGDLVWEIGSGYFGCRDKDGRFDPQGFADKARRDEVKMVEIKLSQGAKPGHGGLLPGSKVTEEIAEVRQIPAHQDCLSPRGHSAFSTPCEMLEFAAGLRDLSGGKPVGIKLCVGHPHEVMAVMKAMLKTGIHLDFIVVDGAEGGTGAAPLELSDWVGMPLEEGLPMVRNALVGSGLKDKVMLGASGKVYSGMGIARNIALGADWCNAARAFMFSIGCIQAQRCHTGTCPTGVTTQDKWRQRGLVVPVQAKRAAQFHRKTLEAVADIVAAVGVSEPSELKPHHLARRISAGGPGHFGEDRHFLTRNILVDDPDATPYAAWWHAASADSFAAQRELRPPQKGQADYGVLLDGN